MKRSVLGMSLAILILALGGIAIRSLSAEELGEIKNFVHLGESDGWGGAIKKDVYWLENSQDAGAIRYYYTPYTEGEGGARSVRVDVNVQGMKPDSRAGLLYGYQQSSRTYYMMLIGPGGEFDVYHRSVDGVQHTMGSSFTLPKTKFIRIEIKEKGREVSLRVNGQSTGSFESRGTGAGSLGIAALGMGKFGFTNYLQTPARETTRSPAEKRSDLLSLPAGNTRPAVALKEVIVRDEGRGNFPAYQFLVPKDWKLEGSVKALAPALFRVPFFDDITITAPDRRFVHFYPYLQFGYNDYDVGQPLQPLDGRPYLRKPESLGQFWSQLAGLDPQKQISNIKLIAEDVIPDATALARRMTQTNFEQARVTTQQSTFSGQRMVYDIQVRRLVVRYAYKGKSMEETLFASLSSTTVFLPDGSVKAAIWGVANMYGVGGPVGNDYLNDPELATVVRSRRINADWSYAIDRWSAGQRDMIIKEGIAKAAAAQKAWKNTRATQADDALDISFNGWKRRSAMEGAGQKNQVDSIHERTTYATSAGESVHLPSYYKNVYSDGQGNYVLHNDANFMINTDPAFNSRDWNRIQPLRR